MPADGFNKNVFINCPFDKDYEPILQSILFCLVYLGFSPRIATEANDSSAIRIEKIRELIESSRYSIHDLSRCQAGKKGEHYRLNMPFELGFDYGCKKFFNDERQSKKFLILEEKAYRYQAALSDIAGCDIKQHAADYQKAVRAVRNWLVSEAEIAAEGATKILQSYTDFQEWYYERQLAAGFSEEDIKDYPTSELLTAMNEWIALGKPI